MVAVVGETERLASARFRCSANFDRYPAEPGRLGRRGLRYGGDIPGWRKGGHLVLHRSVRGLLYGGNELMRFGGLRGF